MSAEAPIRNPAPHRGFNSKAREVLLDGPSPSSRFGLERTGSDEEFRRKLAGMRLNRTDSEATNDSQKSSSSTQSCGQMNDFTDLDEFPKKTILSHKLLSEVGKARSVGDLVKHKKTAVKTFQQLNIMKLPSVDSDLGDKRSLGRSDSFGSLDEDSERRNQYEMK
ncbi:unnamed protein product [Bursaphelenchus xylophilus]|uniref:(pine wood nematode) hypothetical protein n=1 Tax=Bursaphelenchus xylophilus TaxID=6326 RepID=A0A1I7RNQ5_BURXY|nr:unnamed protein product [Bursaphelenchus xylophilus]CAG9124222.1 unnamed protein product [Bursaphelenchus xylophilus]